MGTPVGRLLDALRAIIGARTGASSTAGRIAETLMWRTSESECLRGNSDFVARTRKLRERLNQIEGEVEVAQAALDEIEESAGLVDADDKRFGEKLSRESLGQYMKTVVGSHEGD